MQSRAGVFPDILTTFLYIIPPRHFGRAFSSTTSKSFGKITVRGPNARADALHEPREMHS